MFQRKRGLYLIFALVLIWRIALLVLTVQPIPVDDAFFFDGAVVNWLHHGGYFNPSLSEVFPISGREVYCTYPPLYQVAVLAWMSVFGTSVVAAITLHFVLFAAAGWLVVTMIRRFFPAEDSYAVAGLLFWGITFGDRPDDLVQVLGMGTLYCVLKNLSNEARASTLVGQFLLLVMALYTSVIAAALYFGVGFVATAIGWRKIRRWKIFIPYIGAAAAFVVITTAIAHFKPLYWQGFLENARETPVLSAGFHKPQPTEVVKLVRNASVFVLGVVLVPLLARRMRSVWFEPWACLTMGVWVVGAAMLGADMVLLAANYVLYVLYLQVLLAAGLIAWTRNVWPEKARWVSGIVLAFALLLSVRAVGMSTWGAYCAWHNSYRETRNELRAELAPFTETNAPVIISSPYLYSAAELGVKHPIHANWYFDRVSTNLNADFDAMTTLRPPKIIVSQYEYYRGFASVLEKLRAHPELVDVTVRDQAKVKTPDAIPSLQRVVQHISWAPVMVDLQWKAGTAK